MKSFNVWTNIGKSGTLDETLSKIKRALGVDHMPITAREGLRRTIISFLK